MASTPQNQIQLYYNYDSAMVNKLRTVVFNTTDTKGELSSKPLAWVFASPERAFATMAAWIIKQRGLKESVDDVAKTIPLPIASVTRLTGAPDRSRFVNADVSAPDRLANQWVTARRPLPYTFTYQIDLWSRELIVMDSLQIQILQWLRCTEFWMHVAHPAPVGYVNVLTELTNIADNSTLESEKDQRKLRRTFTFEVKGWLCYIPILAQPVQAVITQFYETGGFVEALDTTHEGSIPSSEEVSQAIVASGT